MKHYLIILITILASLPLQAKKDLSYFWGKHDAYVAGQTEMALELANEILANNPPLAGTSPSRERRAALMMIDQILHDARLDSSEHVATFMDMRMDAVLKDMQTPLKEGVKVYRLYNSGTIVRTPEVTMAWDIYRGPRKFGKEKRRLISDSIASILVDNCDIMFLTHNHSDHIDPFVIDMFLSRGKPVVCPDEIIPDEKRAVHTRKEKIWKEKFKAANGVSLNCTILPGHQDHLQNNIVIATTPGGFSACMTGDQWLKDDLEWVCSLQGKIPPVDLLITHCWAARLPEFVSSFSPKIAITSHENELGHTADHREALWLSLLKAEETTPQVIVMTWGEILSF